MTGPWLPLAASVARSRRKRRALGWLIWWPVLMLAAPVYVPWRWPFVGLVLLWPAGLYLVGYPAAAVVMAAAGFLLTPVIRIVRGRRRLSESEGDEDR